MARITFQLEHGIPGKGSDEQSLLYREVGLRELTSADLIDAQLEAEKVVVQNGKAVAYTSDVLYGLNRQSGRLYQRRALWPEPALPPSGIYRRNKRPVVYAAA